MLDISDKLNQELGKASPSDVLGQPEKDLTRATPMPAPRLHRLEPQDAARRTTGAAWPDPRERGAMQTPPVHRAEDLTEGGPQAQIVLGEQVYTLRITRQNKLILTK